MSILCDGGGVGSVGLGKLHSIWLYRQTMTNNHDYSNDADKKVLMGYENELVQDKRLELLQIASEFITCEDTLFGQLEGIMQGKGPSMRENRIDMMRHYRLTAESFARTVLERESTPERIDLATGLRRTFSHRLRHFSDAYTPEQIVPIKGTHGLQLDYESFFQNYRDDTTSIEVPIDALTSQDADGTPVLMTGLAAGFYDSYYGYITELLESAGPNDNDVANERYEVMKGHVLDVAKVALGATIAGVALRALRRR